MYVASYLASLSPFPLIVFREYPVDQVREVAIVRQPVIPVWANAPTPDRRRRWLVQRAL